MKLAALNSLSVWETDRPCAAIIPTADMLDRQLLRKIINDPGEFTFVDARDYSEFIQGHFRNAISIPAGSDLNKHESLRRLGSKPILVYCDTDQRAIQLRDKLIKTGYVNVKIVPVSQLVFTDDSVSLNFGKLDDISPNTKLNK